MTDHCKWCAEPISQPETGRPREFCDDSERVAYNRRKVTAPPFWDEPTQCHEPMNRATWERVTRCHCADVSVRGASCSGSVSGEVESLVFEV
jgi:hypothetical protein